MSEYRDFVIGAEVFKKLPLKRQLDLIEHTFISLTPSSEFVKEFDDYLTTEEKEYGPKLFHFVLGFGKAVREASSEEVINELKKMGYDKLVAEKLVHKLKEVMPAAERDARIINELDLTQLERVFEGWVEYMEGKYDTLAELSKLNNLPKEVLFAVERFFGLGGGEGLKHILISEKSAQRFKNDLINEYNFLPDKASKTIEVIRAHKETLRDVLLFRYLSELRKT